MHDGQNLFNPNTSFTGYDWKVDEVMSYLISKGYLQEVIVVGIFNSKSRLKEYNYFTSEGRKYSQFIIKELKSFIDENYRTKKTPENTAVLGSSLGGFISFQLFFNFPKTFGKAACMSNSFWVDDRRIFTFIENIKQKYEASKLYLDCGESETELITDNKEMCSLLTKLNILDTDNFYCSFFEGAAHSEFYWAKRLHIPLIFLFGTANGKSKYLYQ